MTSRALRAVSASSVLVAACATGCMGEAPPPRDHSVSAPPPPPPAATAEPAASAASETTVRGGESPEDVIFNSGNTTAAECRSLDGVRDHLIALFAAIGCDEQNHTSAGRLRFICGTTGSFLVTPRQKPDSAAFEVALQSTGNVHMPVPSAGGPKELEWLIRCGFRFPKRPELGAAQSLYGYAPKSTCWNQERCFDYCRSDSQFLAATKKAVQNANCTAFEDDRRVVFTCVAASSHPNCQRNLDGEVSRLVLPGKDHARNGAFSITYRGNAVETCPGAAYGPAEQEPALFGPGFPDFLLQLRNDCRPRPAP